MAKIELPSKITKESWFYKENEELLKPHLGKYYVSYSSVSGFNEYLEDFIKGKIAKISTPGGVYAELGSYVGGAVETGEFGENPQGFTGQENVDLKKLRPKGSQFEKMILIDMGEYVIIGFIDIYLEDEEGATVIDLKTGGKKKEDYYKAKDYVQVVLYAKAIEQTGKKIKKTGVYFIRRTGSHVNPPLHLSEEQFEIPLEYNEERVEFALKKVDKAVREISSLYKTYKKIFG